MQPCMPVGLQPFSQYAVCFVCVRTGISCMAQDCSLHMHEDFVLPLLPAEELKDKYRRYLFRDYIEVCVCVCGWVARGVCTRAWLLHRGLRVQYLSCLVLKDLWRKSSLSESLDLLHTKLTLNPLICFVLTPFTMAFHLYKCKALYKLNCCGFCTDITALDSYCYTLDFVL